MPQRVHRRGLLPQPAHAQPGQQLQRLQEAQPAHERGHAVVPGAGRLADVTETRPTSDQTCGAEPAHLRQVEHGGERLRELRGGHVLVLTTRVLLNV